MAEGTWLSALKLRLRELFAKGRVERELGDEFRFHVDRQTEANFSVGLPLDEARRRALQDFGGAEQLKEECRDARSTHFLDDFAQDLRFGLRMLGRNLKFTSVVVLTLAIGIGANTAIFSVVNAVLLRPLPYRDSSGIVVLWENNRRLNDPRYALAPANLEDFRKSSSAFDDVAYYFSFPFSYIFYGQGDPERIEGSGVSPNLFPLLGVHPVAGRAFLPGDDEPSQSHIAILSYGFWQRRFGGSADILGRTLATDSGDFTVVGVMPAGFAFPSKEFDIWVPATFGGTFFDQNQRTTRVVHYLAGVARLKAGFSLKQARAELETVAQRLEQAYPDSNKNMGASVFSLQEQETGNVRPALLVLLAGVGFVLLIACANVANLLLARGAAREKEIAVRAALGAGRSRIVRQLLTECALTALLGGAMGVLLAFAGVELLKALHPAGIPRMDSVHIDLPVLVFAFAISQLTGLIFGVVPARRQARNDLNDTLKEAGRSSTEGRGHTALRGALVSLEIALSIVLLIGAGLMARSFLRLQSVDPGFTAGNLLTLQIPVPPKRYDKDAVRASFEESLYQHLAALPGVTSVGDVTRLPFAPDRRTTNITSSLNIEGRPISLGQRPEVDFRRASRGYFPAMDIPILAGRNFTERDTLDSPRVAVINEALARESFRGEDPIGRRIQLGPNPNSAWYTIVGVVGSIHHLGLDEAPRFEVYLCTLQNPLVNPFIVVRSTGDPAQLIPAVREVIRSADAGIPVYNMATMNQRLDESLAPRRFQVLLLALFAGMALTLAAIGIYGLMAYSVSERFHEFGIRIALGAQPWDILRMTLARGLRLAFIGTLLGLAGALALTRLLEKLLFGVKPTDPLTFAGVTLLLIAVALAASYLPARRATRADPMTALRIE